jgi:beta-N-acetylhexosaminidase
MIARRRVAGLVLALAVAAGCAGAASPRREAPALPPVTPAQLAGQRLVFAFSGTRVPPELERRIRRGEAAGVILFGGNIASRPALRRLTRDLQAIPRPPGLQAPLLVMIDQEGGLVQRLDGPPGASASAMGRMAPGAVRTLGRATGRLLRSVGVNVDLAPVADVARPGSAIGGQLRSFGPDPARVGLLASAFASGLADAGVAATAKHFPGLGSSAETTDEAPVRITLPRARLRAVDLAPYADLVRARVPLVMLATAVYPALDRRPAALSRIVVRGELRTRLGFRGVTVTDALDTPALAPFGGPAAAAAAAAAAGSDVILMGSYAQSVRAAAALQAGLRSGRLREEPFRDAVARILALRARLPS